MSDARERIAEVVRRERERTRSRIAELETWQSEYIETHGSHMASTLSYQAGHVAIALNRLKLAFLADDDGGER